MSFISNVAFIGLSIAATKGFVSGSASLVPLLVNTQFSDHVKIYFTVNGTIISASLVVLIPSNFPVMLVL